MFYRYGSTQIRNVATIGGNLGSASPIGDTLPILLVLNAKLVLQGKNKELLTQIIILRVRKTNLQSNEFIKKYKYPF